MNIKKITKIITILLIVATILGSFSFCFAADSSSSDSLSLTPSYPTNSGLRTTTSNILGVVSWICYAAAIIMLIMLGVKWVGASPEGKADIKKTAIQYVIGAFLIFVAGTVVNILKNVAVDAVKDK